MPRQPCRNVRFIWSKSELKVYNCFASVKYEILRNECHLDNKKLAYSGRLQKIQNKNIFGQFLKDIVLKVPKKDVFFQHRTTFFFKI